MIVALVFMILSPILAQLIYFALSRRREYLADASGAMYTRWPEGLASALEKLGGTRDAAGGSESRHGAHVHRAPAAAGRAAQSQFGLRHASAAGQTNRSAARHGQQCRFPRLRRSLLASHRQARCGSPHAGGRRTRSMPQSPPAAAEHDTPHRRLRAASDAYLAGAGYTTAHLRQLRRRAEDPRARQEPGWLRAAARRCAEPRRAPRTCGACYSSPVMLTLTTPSSVTVSVFMPLRWKIFSMPAFSGSTSA